MKKETHEAVHYAFKLFPYIILATLRIQDCMYDEIR